MKKRKRHTDEPNYWEPMADSLLGLLFCILLIVLLLILYLIHYKDNENIDDKYGDTYSEYVGDNSKEDDYDVYVTEITHPYEPDNDNDNGGGGDSGSGGDGNFDYPIPQPGLTEGDGTDKAAVYVQVIDGETNRTIKQSGIQFELYTADDNALKELNTYYPKRVEYKKFETDDKGVFYLPEKIELQNYYFKNLTSIAGYDKADDVKFKIEEPHEWDEPYTVTVALYPSKNIIRVQLKDADTGKNLSGSTFTVTAAEEIRTKDDTIRYREGEVVDTIRLDGAGYGESKEVYLGKYNVSQQQIPTYYARVDAIDVVVANKSKGTPVLNELFDPKTKMYVSVHDALYEANEISDAVFTLLRGSEIKIGDYTTDESGKILITNLEKNTTYHFRQESTQENYIIDKYEHSFFVDGDGYINEDVTGYADVYNVITRASFGICDFILRGQISDINMAIMDAEDNPVQVWNSTGLEQLIEGIAPGDYLVVMRGNKNNAKKITIEDKAEVQVHCYYIWTVTDTCIVIILCLVLVLFIVFMAKYYKKKKEKKEEEKKGQVIK